MKHHVLPRLGTFAMCEVARADLEDLVADRDRRVRAGELSWKTAKHVWALVTRMFRDAKASKNRALRVRDDNPSLDIEGPDKGARKVKQFLFPSEFLALVSCERVPLQWRVLFTVAVYTYARGGELAALQWEEVDMDRGLIHVHRAADRRERGTTKPTKTNVARRFPIEPELMPLIALHTAAGGEKTTGPVLPFMSNKSEWSKNLRQYLGWAGLTRTDLFADDATRKPLTFHDLRSTGITWCAVRGDDPLKTSQRAGHEDFKTTQIYIRLAESFADSFGVPFPPLPASVLTPAVGGGFWQSSGFLASERLRSLGKTGVTKWANRDLKAGRVSVLRRLRTHANPQNRTPLRLASRRTGRRLWTPSQSRERNLEPPKRRSATRSELPSARAIVRVLELRSTSSTHRQQLLFSQTSPPLVVAILIVWKQAAGDSQRESYKSTVTRLKRDLGMS